jgi:hypothetical protein
MAWYRAGTVTLTNGSKTVIGVGTTWSSQIKDGDIFFLTANKNDFYEVASVVDDTHLALNDAYTGLNVAGGAYAIVQNFTNTPSADLAAQVADLLQRQRNREDQMVAWLSGSATGGPNSDGHYPVTTLAGETMLIPCPALIDRAAGTQPASSADATIDTGIRTKVELDNPGYWQSLDLNAGSHFHLKLNQNSCEIVFRNPTTQANSVQHFSVILEQTTGSNTISPWPTNVKWNQSRAPMLSTQIGTKDRIDFISDDNGSTWMGFFVGSQIPA